MSLRKLIKRTPFPWKARGYKTGFPTLDRVLGGGISPGTLTIVIGPPGSGRSNFVRQILKNINRIEDTPNPYGEIETLLLKHEKSLLVTDSIPDKTGIVGFIDGYVKSIANTTLTRQDGVEAIVISIPSKWKNNTSSLPSSCIYADVVLALNLSQIKSNHAYSTATIMKNRNGKIGKFLVEFDALVGHYNKINYNVREVEDDL